MAVEASKTRVRVDPETYYDIEQFLLDEADLLDERRFEEWIELMADDQVIATTSFAAEGPTAAEDSPGPDPS